MTITVAASEDFKDGGTIIMTEADKIREHVDGGINPVILKVIGTYNIFVLKVNSVN